MVSLKRLGMLYLSTCVGLGYGLMLVLFPGHLSLQSQSNKGLQFIDAVNLQLVQEY